MDKFGLIKHSMGHWYTPGVTWGYGVGSSVQMIQPEDLVPEIGDMAIIKIKGAANWCGVGMEPDYSPTEYLLVEFYTPERVKVLERVKPGRKWRQAIRQLAQKLNGET